MKKYLRYFLFLFGIFCTEAQRVNGQDKAKPNFSQKVKMEHLKEGFITSGYTFNYEDDVYVLVNNLNIKVLYLIYFMKLTPFTNNISLYRINKSGKNKKGIAESVDIPLKGKMYQFETAWYKDGVLNIYTSHKDGLSKKKHFFCTRFNLKTKKSESAMIMRVDKKEKPQLRLSQNEEFMMAISEKKKDKKNFYINYGVINHENEWIEQGENILCRLDNDLISTTYFVSNRGSIAFSAETRLPKKSLLKKRMHTEEIFGVKHGQLTKINTEDVAEFSSPKKFFVDPSGNLRICHLYGETNKRFTGISIAEVNENNFTVGAHKNFLFKDIVDNTLPQGRVGSYQKITKIRTDVDGSIMVLSENYTERTVTTTTRRGTGSNARYETKTDIFYDYGPGIIYTFDKDFNHIASTRFNYKASYKNQDLGCGLDFICTTSHIYLFSDKYFYKYERGNHAYNGKGYTRYRLKGALKSFVGQHNEYLFDKKSNYAYIFEVISKREFKIHEYNLN